MSLTDDQVLRWFGPPTIAIKRARLLKQFTAGKQKDVPDDMPSDLHSDWRLLKSHGYTDDEAHEAMKPTIRRYWSTHIPREGMKG